MQMRNDRYADASTMRNMTRISAICKWQKVKKVSRQRREPYKVYVDLRYDAPASAALVSSIYFGYICDLHPPASDLICDRLHTPAYCMHP
jgi:hypothetical protein